MDHAKVEQLVARMKQLDGELNGIKAEIDRHESEIEALDGQARPVFEERQAIGRELTAALGL